MLRSIISNGFTKETIIQVFAYIFIIFCVLPIHEFAHGFIAYKLGDDTARLKGRLTINPMAHIDWIGALLLIFCGFGWAKPVPVNMFNLKTKNKKVGMGLVALAGPVSNLMMAVIFVLIRNALIVSSKGNVFLTDGSIYYYEMNTILAVVWFVHFAAQVNVTLAVFNFLPVPPLDGSRILTMFLPNKAYYKIMQYERIIAIVFMIIIFTGGVSSVISGVTSWCMLGIDKLAGLPFGF